jgi:hypothetical protein
VKAIKLHPARPTRRRRRKSPRTPAPVKNRRTYVVLVFSET